LGHRTSSGAGLDAILVSEPRLRHDGLKFFWFGGLAASRLFWPAAPGAGVRLRNSRRWRSGVALRCSIVSGVYHSGLHLVVWRLAPIRMDRM